MKEIDNEQVDNIVIESSRQIIDKLVGNNKLFLGFHLLKIKIFHHCVRCYNCVELEHVSRDCTNKKICFKCGHVGHSVKDCITGTVISQSIS